MPSEWLRGRRGCLVVGTVTSHAGPLPFRLTVSISVSVLPA